MKKVERRITEMRELEKRKKKTQETTHSRGRIDIWTKGSDNKDTH